MKLRRHMNGWYLMIWETDYRPWRERLTVKHRWYRMCINYWPPFSIQVGWPAKERAYMGELVDENKRVGQNGIVGRIDE